MQACKVTDVVKAANGWWYWTDARPDFPNWTANEVRVGDTAYVSDGESKSGK